jgi:hypothetical protein
MGVVIALVLFLLNVTAPTSAAAAKTVAPGSPSVCITVGQPFLNMLQVTSAGAVQQSVDKTSSGLGISGAVWFVATLSGAIWVTNADRTSANPGGLVLPLNGDARATSDLGADARAGAPIYDGFTETSPGAVAALQCVGTNASPSDSSLVEIPDVIGVNAAVAQDQLENLGLTNIEFGSGDPRYSVVIVPAN